MQRNADLYGPVHKWRPSSPKFVLVRAQQPCQQLQGQLDCRQST
jgi:hypothetical protein